MDLMVGGKNRGWGWATLNLPVGKKRVPTFLQRHRSCLPRSVNAARPRCGLFPDGAGLLASGLQASAHAERAVNVLGFLGSEEQPRLERQSRARGWTRRRSHGMECEGECR